MSNGDVQSEQPRITLLDVEPIIEVLKPAVDQVGVALKEDRERCERYQREEMDVLNQILAELMQLNRVLQQRQDNDQASQ